MTLPVIYVAGLVAYDGTDYRGFQYQVGVPTIQGTLEKALNSFSTTVGRIVGAGRTDSGVHAHGQVVAVHVQWRHDVESLRRAWNAHLPASIYVRKLCAMPDGFHPRFSAVQRTYRYYVHQVTGSNGCDSSIRSPLTQRFALIESGHLDIDTMAQAAQLFVGEHDFATFGQPPQGSNTIRHVFVASCQRVVTKLPGVNDTGQMIVVTVSANAFLRHMVRNLVGTLLAVGRGQLAVERIESMLAVRDRSLSAPPVSPNGLILERVDYPEHFRL